MSKILSFCKKTIDHLHNLRISSGKKYILIGVKGGGCNGLKYYIEPTDDTPRKNDELIKDHNIVVCGDSLLYILGSEVIWKTDAMGSRIEFNNPNATSNCGCGETFGI
jgi:iron-sulfur cluster assembly protein